jgi:phage terminase large subunit-like protein
MTDGEMKAKSALDFFSALKLTKGKFHGCYFELLPWQQQIIRDVYGTLKADGTRQYKQAYIEIPKKQGKSELAAAFALKQLCADGEMMAEVYGCAADRAQASIIFDVAVEMIEQEPELKKHCKLVLSRHRIVYLPTKSFYQVLSSESFTKHGLNVSCCVFDEIHAQPNRALFDVMTFGSGDAREQPLFVYVTTAGDDPDRMSICWELHNKAEQILLGNASDPTFYACLYGIDEEEKRIWIGRSHIALDDDENVKTIWKNETYWSMVNPSLGQTVKTATIREMHEGLGGNEAKERLFKQLRLNMWVKYKATKWLPFSVWQQNCGPLLTEREEGLRIVAALRHRKCYGGLDLSSKIDMTAFVLVFPPEDVEPWVVLPFFWMPEKNIRQRVEEDGVKYDIWAKQGLIMLTAGDKVDYRAVEKSIIALGGMYNILEIGYDPWNAYDVEPTLTDAGLILVEVRPLFKFMDPPMKELEALLNGKHLNHGDNAVLNWQFGNLEVVTDVNGNVRPVKGSRRANSTQKTAYEPNRIDGIMALVNAMARAIYHQDHKSIYEERGLFEF